MKKQNWNRKGEEKERQKESLGHRWSRRMGREKRKKLEQTLGSYGKWKWKWKWKKRGKEKRESDNCMNQIRVLPSILRLIHGPHSITSPHTTHQRECFGTGTRVSIYLIYSNFSTLSLSVDLTVQTGLCWNRSAPLSSIQFRTKFHFLLSFWTPPNKFNYVHFEVPLFSSGFSL